MTIMKPTRKEVIEHYRECDHCRHWFKFLKKEKVERMTSKDERIDELEKEIEKLELGWLNEFNEHNTLKDKLAVIKKENKSIKKRSKIEIQETIKDYQMLIRQLKRELKRRGKE